MSKSSRQQSILFQLLETIGSGETQRQKVRERGREKKCVQKALNTNFVVENGKKLFGPFASESGLPDLSWYSVPKQEKYTKMTAKCTKWPYYVAIPNGCQIFQMAINYTNIFHYKVLQNIPKFGCLV
jgi:hypothetical protein